MDPDQTAPTAPTGAVRSGSTMFAYVASNILVETKKPYTFCDYARFKG